ncbi:AAA family ATPase [Clostridium intestinale]|uniref:ATPase n=1 Tax=Clostridium intestinale URNW TaxID=1294142 RepID=U2N6N4_9CLOT|nr:ATP-binding protein [Clostridium intestinale]ERK31172.1 ATPase [Clostridium intestinale URNW]
MKLRSIHLNNVRLFKKFSLNLFDYNKSKSSTLVIIGDNGSGKSTILKSIVNNFSLFNPIYGGDTFDYSDISNNTDEMFINLFIKFNQEEEEYLFSHDSSEEEKEKLSNIYTGLKKDSGHMIYALGDINSVTLMREKFMSQSFLGGNIFYFDAFRYLPKFDISGPNSTNIPKTNKENVLASSIINNEKINTKFIFVKQWLINLDFKRLKNPSPENEYIFSHIVNSFNMLFSPYEFKKITDDGQVLFQNNTIIVNIDKLSDGFKNIFIVIGEILFRLYLNSPEDTRFYEKEAIILIDEIDCHLHPKWQINLIPSLKMLFPNSQIIATTHSPLIINNLNEDEIYRLEE